jgi:phage repressor protein C with HTH and peptisase S24 domain
MIKERIVQLIENKGIAKEKFYTEIGMTSANFRGKAKETPLNSIAIENILSVIPDVNPEWLLTGKGPMLKKNNIVLKEDRPNPTKSVPLIPIDAIAGFAEDNNISVKYEDCEQYLVPEFERSGVEFVIRVSGSSMYPKYANGDILACRKIYDILFFQWGKVYVIDSSQGQLVKRVFEHENQDFILLVSDNKEKYPPFPIPKSDIRSLSIVLGVIRME